MRTRSTGGGFFSMVALLVSIETGAPVSAQVNPNGYITSGNWLVLGPFLHPFGCTASENDLLSRHIAPSSIHDQAPREGDEVQYDPALASTFAYVGPPKNGRPFWRRFDDGKDDDDLDMDLDAVFHGAPEANVMDYAATYFEYLGERPMVAQLCVTSDDGVQVWIDERPVHTSTACRGRPVPPAPGICQDAIAVEIAPGLHRIILAVWENGGGWGGALGFLVDGVPVTDADPDWRFLGIDGRGMSLGGDLYHRETQLPGDGGSCSLAGGGPLAVTIQAQLPPGPPVAEVRELAKGAFGPAAVSAPGAAVAARAAETPRPLGAFADWRVLAVNPVCPEEVGGVTYWDAGTPGDPLDDLYTLDNVGADVWAEGDSFTFAYEKVEGDFILTARIIERLFVPGSRWGKFGVMARQDLTAKSRYAFVNDNGEDLRDPTRFGHRPTQGFRDNVESTVLGGSEHHDWLRLERQGDTFIGSSSPDGVEGSYVELGRTTWVGAPAAVLVGLAGASHTVNCFEDPMSITFSEVERVGGTRVPLEGAPAGVEITWSDVPREALAAGLEYRIDITEGTVRFEGTAGGAPVLGDVERSLLPPAPEHGPFADPDFPRAHGIGPPCAGTSVTSPAPGELVLAGAGFDIWVFGDQFLFSYKEVSGDFSARVTIAGVEWAPGSRWGRAGIMARQDCSLRSRYTLIDQTGEANDGHRLEARPTHGGGDNYDYYVFNHMFPGQQSSTLRLDRCGNTFIGYALAEEDPLNPGVGLFGARIGDWVEVSRHEWIDPPDSVLLGLAVNSTLSCEITTAHFTDWELREGCHGGVLDLACEPESDEIKLSWRNPPSADPSRPISIRIDGEEVESIPGSRTAASVRIADLAEGRVSILGVVDSSGVPVSCSVPAGFSREGFITDWLILGPFAQRGSFQPGVEAIRLDYLTDGAAINEIDVEPRPGDQVHTDFGGASASPALVQTPLSPGLNPGGVPTWSLRRERDDSISIDLFAYPESHLGTDMNNIMVYAVTYLEVEEDREVSLAVASNDSIQVLLDGEEIHINNVARGQGRPNTVQDIVPGILLDGGRRRLMVKLFEGYGDTAFRLRFQDEKGNPVVEGLRVVIPAAAPGRPLFHRGDVNDDGQLNITDPINLLGWLFLGGSTPSCLEAANANDDRSVDLSDAIYLLNYQFGGGPAPPAPGPVGQPCGPDPEGSPNDLGCEAYTRC